MATYYVKNGGNDSNSGLSDALAWATISKVTSSTFSAGDSILLKRGSTWQETMTISDSGSVGSPITIGAYDTGANPILYGSKVISGSWTLHSGNIYWKSESSAVEQVFEDGVVQQNARWPNSGYKFIDSHSGKTQITDSELPTGYSHAGGRIMIRTRAWVHESKSISSSSGTTVTFSSSNYEAPNGSGYILINKLEYLDAAGQWYHDTSANKLYYWASGNDTPANYTIRATTLNQGIVLSGTRAYITIENIDFYHHGTSAIDTSQISNVKFDNCKFIWPIGRGINSQTSASSNNTCTNCTFEGARARGFDVKGSNWTVTYNSFESIGRFDQMGRKGEHGFSHGQALNMWTCPDAIIRYNTFLDCGGIGIEIFDSPDSFIEYNYLENTVLDKTDLGAIYVEGGGVDAIETSEDATIQYNIVDNVPGEATGYPSVGQVAIGIYLDRYATLSNVKYNTIISPHWASLFSHHGGNHDIQNNTFYDTGDQGVHFRYHENATSSNVDYNILYGFSGNKLVRWRDMTYDPTQDNNQYINHYATDVFHHESNVTNFSSWKTNSSVDTNSSMDASSLGTDTERILYNVLGVAGEIDCGAYTFQDIDGNDVTGTKALAAWDSIILTGTTSELATLSVTAASDIKIMGVSSYSKVIGVTTFSKINGVTA